MKTARLENHLRQSRGKELSRAYIWPRSADLDIGCEFICRSYCRTRFFCASARRLIFIGNRPGRIGDPDSSPLQQLAHSAVLSDGHACDGAPPRVVAKTSTTGGTEDTAENLVNACRLRPDPGSSGGSGRRRSVRDGMLRPGCSLSVPSPHRGLRWRLPQYPALLARSSAHG